MKIERELQINRVYRHFKGNYYLVINSAKNSENLEEMVVYRALYGDYKIWVRPLKMFLEEVPKEKDNPTGQKYRFEITELK